MNIQENIKKKSEDLIRKAKALPNVAIKWEKPILIKCAELNSKSDLDEMMKVFENYTSKPGVYYFEIVSKQKGQEIVNTLLAFKEKKLRSCPKIDKKRSVDSKYLYCGSRKKRFTRSFYSACRFWQPKHICPSTHSLGKRHEA